MFVNEWGQKMYGIFALSLKVTNWCNLNCAHCRENSGRDAAIKPMPLEKVEDYISQFQELPINLSNRITIDGGEPMLPYFMGDENYIPTVLCLVSKAGATPTIKTNGTWGNTYTNRSTVLKSLAKNAYFVGRPLTINVPVDEFHNNISGVSNIIADVVFSDYLRGALNISVSGFDTIGSVVAYARLRSDLRDREINTVDSGNDNLVAYNDDGVGIHVETDYMSGVVRCGRAIKNHVYTEDNLSTYVNKIQIDNDDNVALNYVARDNIKNRPLANVIDYLIKIMDTKQK